MERDESALSRVAANVVDQLLPTVVEEMWYREKVA